MATHTLVADVEGRVRLLYSDETQELTAVLGPVKIRRASHVEPTPEGRWLADMAPVGGPQLGPYESRGQALRHESAWLLTQDIPIPGGEAR